MTPEQFPVISGPSKFNLSNALFVWDHRRPVTFQANCPVGTIFEVYVLSVQAEDGSGESWNVEGTIGEVSRASRSGQANNFLPKCGERVFLYYRTDSRQGYVKFFEKGGHRTLAALDQAVQIINERHFGDGRPVRR